MAKKKSTKSRIVEAAWQLFQEKGYDETTIEDIIALSDTSKGTFYHYFPGKDALLSSLSELFDSYYEELLPELSDEMNAVDKLIELCCRVHRTIGKQVQPNLLAYLYSSQVVTRGNRHLLDKNRLYYTMISQIAEAGIRKGGIRAALTVQEISQIYAMCERAIIYDYCIHDAAYDLGEFTARAIPLLLQGIRA